MSELTKSKKKARIHEGNPLITVLLYATCIMLCFLCLYPMWYVLCCSLSQGNYVDAQQVWWIPRGFTLHAYKLIFMENDMWRAYANTIVYVIGATLLQLVFCMLAAYPLTCKNMIGRKVITTFFLIPMYFGAGLIPTFLTYSRYGLVDNPLVMILTNGCSIWYMILTRTYLLSIPEALRDSAKIDGASHFRTLLSIYLPLAKPIIAVVAIYTVIGVWNSWSTANIYLRDTSMQPLQLYLRRVLIKSTGSLTQNLSKEQQILMQQQRLANLTLRYSMIIFTTLPVLCVYPFFQKYFVKGVMIGSVKG